MNGQTPLIIAQAGGFGFLSHIFILSVAFSYFNVHAAVRRADLIPERRRIMTFYTGCIAAVPTVNKQKYIDHVGTAWTMLRGHGAARMVESWGVDARRAR
jgi:hypothetical protein